MSDVTVILKAGQAVPNNVMLGRALATSSAPSAVAGKTRDAWSAGSTAYKYVVAIEGYPYLLSDAAAAAVLTAWSGSDWQQVLGGLYVELDHVQQIHPWEPFQGGGKCILRVQADASDTFGIDTHRKSAGAESILTAGANRNGSSASMLLKIPLDPNVIAPALIVDKGIDIGTGDAYCGTECVEISSATQRHLWTSRRGKYSPFGAGGTGGRYFAEHHRVMADTNGVMLNPLVTKQPRTWIGKWVGVYMHLVDGSGALNSLANAQCVFAGRIAAISDDPGTGYTCVELAHINDVIKTTTLGRDLYSGSVVEGIYIAAGRTFSMSDNSGSVGDAGRATTALTVVASGASGANQVNADIYTLEEICSFVNRWLASELAAGRLYGSYQWSSPVNTNAGPRTRCGYTIPNASTTRVEWWFSLPNEVAVFLGIPQGNPSSFGSQFNANDHNSSNLLHVFEGASAPWRTVAFRSLADSLWFQMVIDNERGNVFDQYAFLPSIDKPTASQGRTWGIFLVDEKYLVLGYIDVEATATTINCIPSNYALPGVVQGLGIVSYGRRTDDTSSGPITVRQIFILEMTFATLLKTLFYNSGTGGYNSPTYDNIGYGLGIALPGSLLGAPFELSIDNLPGAQSPIACVIDESITLPDLLGADLTLRNAFPIWKPSAGANGTGGVVFGQWQTPTAELAVVALTESNKAEPTGHIANQRSATVLSDEWQHNVIKIDYNRDFTLGRDGVYQNSLTLEDHVSVDDVGGGSKPLFTLRARNTFRQARNTGAGIEALAPGLLARMPLFSRPARRSTRSLDMRQFFAIGPGDVVLVSDNFMRDPATGTRKISSRAALVTRHRFNPGGPTPGNPAKASAMTGEADLYFLDLHRYTVFAPSAELATYDAPSRTLTFADHEYSESTEITDISRFAAGDAVIISEIDPSDPTAALSWQRLIAVHAGTSIVLNQVLDNFDVTKKYRMTFDRYSAAGALQQGKAYQASSTTARIENVALPYQWSDTPEPNSSTANGATDQADLLPATAYGDGRAFDAGHERALARTLNRLIDHKTAKCTGAIVSGNRSGIDPGGTDFSLLLLTPIFLGSDLFSNAVFRYLIVSPIVAVATSAHPASFRVTLSRLKPTAVPSDAFNFGRVAFNDQYSQASWFGLSTQATQILPATSLPIVKDTDGLAWLSVEGTSFGWGSAHALGFAQLYESARAQP